MKHALLPIFADVGSLARHIHRATGRPGDPVPFAVALRCPTCNPNHYARHYSKHRKATP